MDEPVRESDWREECLRAAEQQYTSRVAAIVATYESAMWAAREMYRRQTSLVDQADPNLSLVDPISGLPFRDANLSPPSLPWERQEAPATSEPESVGAVDFRPGGQNPDGLPPVDLNAITAMRAELWQLIVSLPGAFSGKQLLKAFLEIYPKHQLTLPDLKLILREFTKAGSLMKADASGENGNITFYMNASLQIPMKQAVEKAIQQLSSGESLVRRPTPRRKS